MHTWYKNCNLNTTISTNLRTLLLSYNIEEEKSSTCVGRDFLEEEGEKRTEIREALAAASLEPQVSSSFLDMQSKRPSESGVCPQDLFSPQVAWN